MAIDEAKLNELVGRFINDLGATGHAATMVIGDRLGLYRALAVNGPSTPAELAASTGTAQRYVAEWLAGQAAGGYITYDPTSGRYLLSEEQAMALADEHSPAFLPGGAQFVLGVLRATPAITEAFQTGQGVGWHEHHPDAFAGTERFFRSVYLANLEDNLNPVGRMFYSFSTLACVPNALSQEPRVALGGQAGEGRLRQVLSHAGFTRLRRAAQTPFNLVLEARL
jgi:hypothetical protein